VLASVLLALVAIASGPGATALGAAPDVRIKSPASGSTTNDTTPVIAGTTDVPSEEELLEELGAGEDVEVSIYDALGGGEPLQKLAPATPAADGRWSTHVQAPLAPGTYRAVAKQEDAGMPGFDEVTFTVDTSPPEVVLSSPVNGSSTSGGSVAVGGSAGTAAGDLQAITVALYGAEGIAGQPPIETLGVQASKGVWSGTFGGLAAGSYTVQASQRDEAGNAGTSAPASFTVDSAAAAPGPTASFSWVPSAPVVGESVSLVSSSTDSASPITGFAWALGASGAFIAGKPVLTTSFSTPGNQVVRLRVSDADGRSSIATETVSVSAHPTVLMQPFPVVRIAGSITGRGARIRRLAVQAPIAARITIRGRGGGCRTKSESRSAKASSTAKHKVAAVLLSFNRFARSYRAGARLEVLVVKAGEIGKYTVFKIRRHKLPIREDACIVAAGAKPIACTSS